jgi:polyphenol oxidase
MFRRRGLIRRHKQQQHDRAGGGDTGSMLTAGAINALDGVRHAFFTRSGGVSEGIYASLNCGFGSGDDRDRVAQNRARAARRLDVAEPNLWSLHQVHGVTVIDVDGPWNPDARLRADAMVTTRPGFALGILTADCAPVLIADAEARVIGAAHAGWRGALAGVIEATVAAMVKRGANPARMVAAVGPCIAQRSYEVGPEFPAPFLAGDPGCARFFAHSARNPEKFLFDLRGYCTHRIFRAGVRDAAVLPNDTCVEEQRFFSYRRSCLKAEKDYGRGLSAIALEP